MKAVFKKNIDGSACEELLKAIDSLPRYCYEWYTEPGLTRFTVLFPYTPNYAFQLSAERLESALNSAKEGEIACTLIAKRESFLAYLFHLNES